MKRCTQKTETERLLRQSLFRRLLFQWGVFFGILLVLVGVLELLYGKPQPPSAELFVNAWRDHALVFAAILVLIPIAVRDTVRCVQDLVKRHCLLGLPAETENAQNGPTDEAAPSGDGADLYEIDHDSAETRETAQTSTV